MIYSSHMNTYYSSLVLPVWAPPAWMFGPVWTVLYLIICCTFSYVVFLRFRSNIPTLVLLPFLLNIIFNLLFTPIQFGLQNNLLATIDITLVLATLIWALIAIFPYARIVTYANIPYLLWVIFATILQYTITYLN
jgi:tryptophan-rich sensory protein